MLALVPQRPRLLEERQAAQMSSIRVSATCRHKRQAIFFKVKLSFLQGNPFKVPCECSGTKNFQCVGKSVRFSISMAACIEPFQVIIESGCLLLAGAQSRLIALRIRLKPPVTVDFLPPTMGNPFKVPCECSGRTNFQCLGKSVRFSISMAACIEPFQVIIESGCLLLAGAQSRLIALRIRLKPPITVDGVYGTSTWG